MSNSNRALVIGAGFVGGALIHCMRQIPRVLDPKHPETIGSLDAALNDRSKHPEIIFICLPTPAQEDGSCDANMVLGCVSAIAEHPSGYEGLVVIKSTIPPSVIEQVQQRLPNFVYWPELLREKFADEDMQNPRLTVLGSQRYLDRVATHVWLTSMTRIVSQHVTFCTPIEASVFKYATNSFLALKVVFMHELYQWMESRDQVTEFNRVVEMLGLEGRVGSSHLKAPGTHGLGFGGACFPKDTQALATQAQADGSPLQLLEAGIVINQMLQGQTEE